MGVITGIIRVVRAGIFSDLNNLKERSILNKEYDEYFGFLEKETKEALKYYEIDSKLGEVHLGIMDIDLEIQKYITLGVF